MAGTRVVITGGQGFIGRHVSRLLADAGAQLVLPHRPDRGPLPGLPGHQLPLDLHDSEQLAGVLREGDLLVHLAARSGGIQFQESFEADVFDENRRITRNVLEAARQARVRRLFIASSAVIYGGDSTGPLTESARLVTPFHDRVTGYAWSKVTDEVLAAWFGAIDAFEVVIGRLTSVYGPGGSFDPSRSTVVHSLVRKAVEAAPGGSLEVWGTGNAVRSFLHVDDAARAVVTVLERGRSGQAYNLDAAEPVTIRELAKIVRDAVDPDLDLFFNAERPEGVRYRVLDNSKLRALGFVAATALETGVKGTVEDYLARSSKLRARG